MKNKLELKSWIDIIYWTAIIIMTISELYNSGLNEFAISELFSTNLKDITIKQYFEFASGVLVVVVICLLFSMFRAFWFTIAYFGVKIAVRKHRKEKLEKIDWKNDNYYRDVLPKYSASVLSYIDDFKIDKKDIVATLLMLELKKKIKMEDDSITILDKTLNDLEENEKYILNNIKNNKLEDVNLLEYTNLVKKDSLKMNLLSEKEIQKNAIKKKIINCVIMFIVLQIIIVLIPTVFSIQGQLSAFVTILMVILFSISVFFPGVAAVQMMEYKSLKTLDPYIRSKEGKILNAKLEGLRKYLRHFSTINEKSKEQLVFWEEYLIYSVILGVNTKIVEELNDKIF